MNSTRPHTRALAAAVLGTGTAVIVGPVTVAAADRPAVRVAPARPMDPGGTVARAAPSIPPPPFDPLDPSRPYLTPPTGPAKSEPFQSAFGTFQPPKPTPPKPAAPAQPATAPKGVGGWVNDRWASVRTAVLGPAAPAPTPKVGTQPAPTPNGPAAYPPFVAPAAKPTQPQPTAKVNAPPVPPAAQQPFRGVTAAGRPGYAGLPAYRWYGWGTAVPGANPFAPGGDYPAGSSHWYALSGATPGAFPVPVTNAFRPPPDNDPPAYVVAPPPPSAGPKLVYNPPAGPRPIAESGTPVVSSKPAADMQWQPIAGPRPASPGFAPPAPVVSPPSDPRWTPAAPIFRGQSGS